MIDFKTKQTHDADKMVFLYLLRPKSKKSLEIWLSVAVVAGFFFVFFDYLVICFSQKRPTFANSRKLLLFISSNLIR